MAGEPQQLIDEIYEAAAVADQWPRVLGSLASMFDSDGAVIVSSQRDASHWVCTPSMAQTLADFAALGRPEMNPRPPRAIARRHPGFLTDHDILTEEELQSDPFYVDVLRPRGFGWCAGSTIFAPGGDTLIVSVERRFSRGPFSSAEIAALDALRPHIARAATFSARLGLERVRAATEALGFLGLPAAVLGGRYHLLTANALFQALIPNVFRDHRERLSLVNTSADTLLADALARDAIRAAGAVQSIPLPAAEGRDALVVHVVPIRGAARDIFSSARALVLATPVAAGLAPAQQLLEGLFDLTPAEARVARGIGEGETVEQIAAGLGISRQTIRAQLKSVFAKTGTHRQAELVRLLNGVRHFEK